MTNDELREKKQHRENKPNVVLKGCRRIDWSMTYEGNREPIDEKMTENGATDQQHSTTDSKRGKWNGKDKKRDNT